MFFNFCDPRLRPEIHCSTISTEGHEVTNLITNSDKGFLAYSCIKPPVNIDITFLYNISINHILIWPCVGSQKSSGFQLYAKTSNDHSMPYTLLSTGYLDQLDSGLLFYPSNVNCETIPTPHNFVKRYIKNSMHYLTTYTNKLRICICKTENSVPALSKIQVWGTVSPRCGKDVVASVYSLWSKQETSLATSTKRAEKLDTPVAAKNPRKPSEESLEVPECFLDAITYEIMTQPITLPSGKVIDQSTLQKHEENEALWGRTITDPFTGIRFNEHRKPVVATSLKMRIDKFLLENSNAEEIKKLPRVLGRALPTSVQSKILEIPKYSLKDNVLNKAYLPESKTIVHSSTSTNKSKTYCHKLPVVVMCSKQGDADSIKPVKRRKVTNSYVSTSVNEQNKQINCADAANVNAESNIDINTIVPNLKRFDVVLEKQQEVSPSASCTCCIDGIFYQLPCKHILCRKVLTSIENNQCTLCGMLYKTSEVRRIYE